ncbi:MAG: UDP-N-acetylmuramate dehydrogenase [Candidatus Nealsonbacteria bacterium]
MDIDIDIDIKKELSGVRENVSLAEYTTFKIGGKARYFYIAENKQDLIRVIKIIKRFKIPFFILSGGSNILFSDKGFNGIVIKFQACHYKLQGNNIYVESGLMLDKLSKIVKNEMLTGLEWGAGIPGTIGGAIYGNAQAFGSRISDSIKEVEALNTETLEIQKILKKDCLFSLKNGIFKENKNLIILSAIFEFKKADEIEIEKKIEEFLNYRKTRHPLKYPSAGSVFINPEIKISSLKLLKEFPEIEELNKKGIIHSGWLIEKCGLKGKQIGKAKFSDGHANFIVNLGGAKSKDVLALIKLAKQKIKEKFGIELKEEIQIVNY